MAGPNVGYATLSIVPSFRGVQSSMAGQLAGPLKSASDKSGKDSAESFMSGFSGKAKLLAKSVGVVAAAALTKGFTDHIANEKAFDKTAAAFGLDAETSERLGDAAGRIYAGAWGDSLGQVSDAIALVQQGLGRFDTPIEDLERMTEHALDFATAFDTDVTEGITAATLLVKNGLAKDGVEAFDLLTLASQQLAPAMRDELLAATNEYSQFFSGLGLSGEEAFTGLVRAAERGGNFGVDKFGDALKELTIRATDMSTASVEAYEIAGLNAEKMSARFLEGGDVARGALDDLVEGLLDIKDPVTRANAAIGLFGTPLEDLSVAEIPTFLEGLTDMTGGLGDVAGAAAAMGDTLNDNAATKIESFKRTALLGLSNFVGNTVIPALERLAPTFQAGLGAASAWWATHGPAVIQGFTDLKDAIALVVTEALADLSDWWDDNGPTVILAAETLAAAVLVAFEGLIEAGGFVIEHWDQFKYVAGVMAAAVGVHYVRLAVGATISAATQVAAWVTTKLAAIASSVVMVAQVAIQIASWALLAARAAVQAAIVVASWALTAAASRGATTAHGVAVAAQVAGWGTLSRAAVLHAGRIAGAWIAALAPMAAVIAGAEAINNLTGNKLNPNDLNLWERLDPRKAFKGLDLSFDIPFFASGGVMPGPRGQHSLAWVAGGETIIPTHERSFAAPSPMEGLVVMLDGVRVGNVVRKEGDYYHRRNG